MFALEIAFKMSEKKAELGLVVLVFVITAFKRTTSIFYLAAETLLVSF